MTACSWGPKRIDIFALNATKDRMIQYYFDDSWEGPVSHDYTEVLLIGKLNPFAFGINCASWGSNRIDIFGQDSTGIMEQIYYDGGWHGATLPQNNLTPIVVCAPESNHVDTFSIDPTGDILHVYYDGQWKTKTIDNPFPGQDWTLQSACSWGKGRIDLFGLDGAGKWLHVAHGWDPEALPQI